MASNSLESITIERIIGGCETLLARIHRETRDTQLHLAHLPELRRLLSTVNDIETRVLECRTAIDRKRPQKKGADPSVSATQFVLTEAFQNIFGKEGKGPPQVSSDAQAVDRVVFSGSVFSVAEVLQFLEFNMRTGTVRVHCPDEMVTIDLLGGSIVGAWSNNAPAGQRLGDILVAQGAISAKTLDAFLRKNKGNAKRLGRALTHDNLISEDAVYKALKHQVERLFSRCLAAGPVDTDFQPKKGNVDTDVFLNLTAMLLEGSAAGERPET